MTQKEKQLLLKDLFSRISYGVKVQNNSYKTTSVNTIEGFDGNVFIMKETYESLNFNTNISTTKNVTGYIHKIKPYLRSMSSMTEEEKKEFTGLIFVSEPTSYGYLIEHILFAVDSANAIDWLNAHYFDYRGLIPKGLALEAPKDMYKIV